MPYFALAVVPHDWDNKTPLTFTQAQYNEIRPTIEAGTHIILFRDAPASEVIGQAQTPGLFLKASEWPQQSLGSIDASNPDNAYLLPIEVSFLLHGELAPVPLSRVREVLGDLTFPHAGERWRKISDDEYDALRDGWT